MRLWLLTAVLAVGQSKPPQKTLLNPSIETPSVADSSSVAESSLSSGKTRRLPGAVIFGVKKAGTRALLEYLRLHPAVAAPGPEVHFFDRHYDRGLDWYRAQMPPTSPNQLTVEKTPAYFASKVAPGRIAATLGRDVKLLLVLRDPVTRALSDYAQTASKRPGHPPFSAMAFLNDSTHSVNASWGGIRLGRYHRHLRKWLNVFPRRNIHFVSGEALVHSPATEMSAVESFLGLPRFVGPQHFALNASSRGPFPCLRKDAEAPLHCLGASKGRAHPAVSDSDLGQLRAFFRPENRELYKMVGRDFGWD